MIDYRTESRYPGLWRNCIAAYSADIQQQVYNGQFVFNQSQNWLHAQANVVATQPNTKRWAGTDGLKWMWYGQDWSAGYAYTVKGRFPDLLNDWTFAAWIVIETEVTGSPIIARNSPQSMMFASIGQLLEVRQHGVATYCTGATSLSLNTLYHVAATRRGNTFTVWLNGQSDGSGTGTPTWTAGTAEDEVLLFDGQGVGYGRSFQGYKEDVRIYDRALNQDEIQLLARYRGIAYELKPQLWYAEAAATSTIKPQIIWW